jgi:hypothetical protein
VKPHVGQLRRSQERLKFPRHVPRVEWRPHQAGENKAAVLPAPAGRKPRLKLTHPMRPERLDRAGRAIVRRLRADFSSVI